MAKLVNTDNTMRVKTILALKERIRLLQADERELRLELLKDLFGEDNVGSKKQGVGDFIVTGKYTISYSFNQEEIEDALECGDLSDEAAEAIRVKYELDKRKYKALDDDIVAELDNYLTAKPDMPAIEIKYIGGEDGN